MKILQNPNEEIAKEIKRQVKENDGYCPCALERNKATKCICQEFREQIKRGEAGECHCGLYVAVKES